MSNPMRYIKNLEAVGFERNQAEAQVQMVLDAIEGDLVTKNDFALFQERIENKFAHFENRFESKLIYHQQQVQTQIKESEFRLVTRLGFLTVSTVSIAVAILTWLIKV